MEPLEIIGRGGISSEEESVEAVLYKYLQPDFPFLSSSPVTTNGSSIQDDNDDIDTFAYPYPSDQVQLQLDSFSDLQAVLRDIDPGYQHNDHYQHPHQHYRSFHDTCSDHNTAQESSQQCTTTEEGLATLSSSELSVPSSIRLNIVSSSMLDSLMHRAITHWCCIGFKVAPISLDLIKDWHRAPPAIVYCVASISLVTFMDHQAGQAFVKQAAMGFYEQARHKIDDVFIEDIHPLIIQAYFCLSYTSNLLRLYEQQRTWGSLASIALQQCTRDMRAGRPVDQLTMLCFFRWYYVDAWMCLTLNRECLLPDDMPVDLNFTASCSAFQQYDVHSQDLYRFAALTQYMRRYIRAMQSNRIFDTASHQQDRIYPSALYLNITNQLKQWYSQQFNYHPTTGSLGPTTRPDLYGSNVHFHLCYNAMRLVVLFRFLQPDRYPPYDILIDCLETSLCLLQSLQYLKDIGCDQSTYHHMFFAIHNTAMRIYRYERGPAVSLKAYARDQLRINLMLLKGTQAYANDLFKVRLYAEKIEQQFNDLGITLDDWLKLPLSLPCSSSSPASCYSSSSCHAHPTTTTHSSQPRILVFRQKPLKISTSSSKHRKL